MTAPGLWQVMRALASRVTDATGLISSAEMVGSIDPPFLMVGVPPIDAYRATFSRGKVIIDNWPLYLFTSARLDYDGQRADAEYADWTGPKSIALALEADKTLGGLVTDLAVMSSRPLGLEEVGAIPYYGRVFNLTVELPGI